MAGVTPQGWVSKTLTTIVQELADRAKDEFGEDFPTTPDSGFGVLANIVGASNKDVWDLGQSVADLANKQTASGIYLDYIAAYVGIARLQSSGSTGEVIIEGLQGTTIPAFYLLKDELNRNVLTDEDLELNRSTCYKSTFSVNTVLPSTDYIIVVEGDQYSYTSSGSPTADEVLTGLESLINTGTGYSALKVEETLVVSLDTLSNTLTTTNSANINLDSVGSLVTATAADVGDLSFPAGTVNKLGASSLEILSVTNPEDFLLGRFRETDAELRIRISQSGVTGTATKPAIEAALANIVGVTGVTVDENEEITTSPSGVPPKAYEAFVSGGSEEDIADVLWTTKPAGIKTHGTISKIIIDENGDEQTVRFSRKTDLSAWVRVTYSINSEEDFPANGEDLMKSAVVSFGNNLATDEDFEPTKFYAPLYTVKGVYIDLIEIATTNLPTDIPSYQTTRIPVSDKETLIFTTDQVTLTTV